MKEYLPEKAYEEIRIYNFSGTGNARAAADWIIDEFSAAGIPGETINIAEAGSSNIPEPRPRTLTGFCFPTHGFNIAPLMLNFISRFPAGKNTDCFLLNTRAGMKIGSLVTPGLSGIALLLPVLILKYKGYSVRGLRPLDMPSNWLSLHPALRGNAVVRIHEYCQKILTKFSGRLMQRKHSLRGLVTIPIDLLLAPIAVLYYLVGRFALAKTFIATSQCNQCGLCEKDCPVSAIKMVGERPYWKFTCESCMHCMNHCPSRAIETCHGFTFVLWWAISSTLPAFLLAYIFSPIAPGVDFGSGLGYLFFTAVYYFAFLAMIWPAYRALHYLMRFKAFNNLIRWTSLTSYRFWGRYRSVTPR